MGEGFPHRCERRRRNEVLEVSCKNITHCDECNEDFCTSCSQVVCHICGDGSVCEDCVVECDKCTDWTCPDCLTMGVCEECLDAEKEEKEDAE
jgi:hypothetical protein